MKIMSGLVLVLVLALLVAACGPQATLTPVPQGQPTPALPSSPPAKPTAEAAKAAWQVEWDRTVEAAKKEGTLVHVTQLGPAVPRVVSQAFKSQFGINIEWLSGSSSELAVRIMGERRAGIYSADVGIIAHVTPRTGLKPAGALQSLEGVLFLPELTDPQLIKQTWRAGRLEWVDADAHSILVFAPYVNIPMMINTQLVKDGEIKGYKDLLNPKWKGKIVLLDPTISTGSAPTWAQAVGTYIMGWDYLTQLVDQEPFVTRDNRLAAEGVAKGKYAVSIAVAHDVMKEFLDIGAPVQLILPVEGNYTVAGPNTIIEFKNSPHPNAAKLYVNWLLSKEGQATYCAAQGSPSGRADVPIQAFSSLIVPDPKLDYTKSYSEEAVMAREDAINKSKAALAKLKK